MSPFDVQVTQPKLVSGSAWVVGGCLEVGMFIKYLSVSVDSCVELQSHSLERWFTYRSVMEWAAKEVAWIDWNRQLVMQREGAENRFDMHSIGFGGAATQPAQCQIEIHYNAVCAFVNWNEELWLIYNARSVLLEHEVASTATINHSGGEEVSNWLLFSKSFQSINCCKINCKSKPKFIN